MMEANTLPEKFILSLCACSATVENTSTMRADLDYWLNAKHASRLQAHESLPLQLHIHWY